MLHSAAVADIRHAADPEWCAVIVSPGHEEPWLQELSVAVTSGRLTIPRTVLPAVTLAELAAWGATVTAGLPGDVATALVDDMVAIAERVVHTDRASIERVQVRSFTESPTRRCGFHVDTVPAQAPVIGALRVYNGATTEYVEPCDVLSVTAFYDYLSRRERLSRVLDEPASTGPVTAESAHAELTAMDEAPQFLRAGGVIRRVPERATVYFKHLDIRRHWSPHPLAEAWIHRSPMNGAPRLVLNVSPAQGSRPARSRRSAERV
ncbi:hypothetical protein [Streptomyces sp. NPDC002550]